MFALLPVVTPTAFSSARLRSYHQLKGRFLLGLRHELDARRLQHPSLDLLVVLAQQIERADLVVLLGSRACFVSHDLPHNTRRDFEPLRQAGERSPQTVKRQAGHAGPDASACVWRVRF